jgi:hypothetical protein
MAIARKGMISKFALTNFALTSVAMSSVALSSLSLTACGTLRTGHCAPNEQIVVNETLYFGTAMPDGVVSPEQWTEFVNNVVTPRFPQGLTMWQASGQWRSAQGEQIWESSHVLTVDHPDDARSDAAVREIMHSYKTQYHQEAVLRVRALSCASF